MREPRHLVSRHTHQRGYHALNVAIGDDGRQASKQESLAMSTTATASAGRTRAAYAARAFSAGHPTLPRARWQLAMSVLMAWLISVTPAHAQLATQHIKGVVGLKGGSPPPQAATSLHLSSTFTTPTQSGREKAIGFRSTRTYQALRWQEASTSSQPKRFWEATTVSRCCFPSGPIIGFRPPRSTRILAGA
jgi:hypothetical protein